MRGRYKNEMGRENLKGIKSLYVRLPGERGGYFSVEHSLRQSRSERMSLKHRDKAKEMQ